MTMTEGKNSAWLSARIILEYRIDGKSIAEFEDRIVLLRANSFDAARKKAEEYGRWSGERYENEYGQTVTWECIGVVDIKDVFEGELVDGHPGDCTQLYWQFIGLAHLKRIRKRHGGAKPEIAIPICRAPN